MTTGLINLRHEPHDSRTQHRTGFDIDRTFWFRNGTGLGDIIGWPEDHAGLSERLSHAYMSLDARLSPWAEDDTIGIPALDSRYDEIAL